MNKFRKSIRPFTNFPQKGVLFWDFTPLCENPKLFQQAISRIKDHYRRRLVTKVVAIESKGFVIGSALAYAMHLPLAFIRKPGLTPGKTLSQKFKKEYGFGEYQLKLGVVHKNDSVLLVYDIMAGSGAAEAGIKLVESASAKVAGLAFIIELEYLGGRNRLGKYDIFSLVKIPKKSLK